MIGGLKMLFRAEFSLDSYGFQICLANSIEELISKLNSRGFKMSSHNINDILKWATTTSYRYYGQRITITKGEPIMTEGTSL